MSDTTFSLDELCALAATPKRTVRYYIQIGLLPRPVGENRGARYLPIHLDSLLRIQQLSEAGISLARIREVLGGEAPVLPPRAPLPGSVSLRSVIFVAPGVELVVSPDQAPLSAEQLRRLAQEVSAIWENIQKGTDEN